MPIDYCSGIGAAIAHISRYCYRESEQRARTAWITLRPKESDRASVDVAMTRLWKCVSRTMAEFAVLDRLWANGRITVEGVEHLDRARAQKRPRLVAALHLGNWEVIPVTLIALGHAGAGAGIYLPPENRIEHQIALEVRTRLGAKLVAAGSHTVREAIRTLKQQDGLFVMFIDEFIRGRVHAPAFGRRLRAEGNIAYAVRLAVMTGAVIIPAYCERLGDAARFKVTFLPPLDFTQTAEKDVDLLQNIAKLDAIIAPIIRDHLDQWYYVLDFDFGS
jgi:KDO2-lipid IV(A) lauroyltransferase